eukprot:g17056.t1
MGLELDVLYMFWSPIQFRVIQKKPSFVDPFCRQSFAQPSLNVNFVSILAPQKCWDTRKLRQYLWQSNFFHSSQNGANSRSFLTRPVLHQQESSQGVRTTVMQIKDAAVPVWMRATKLACGCGAVFTQKEDFNAHLMGCRGTPSL